jgi:RNA polymerase-interacting CarD/CdnL/TRCF family regulator
MEGSSLRGLTPASEFQKLFDILGSPAEPLSTDRLERKSQLSDRIKDGTLESICCVIRDLSYQRRMKKLSDSDQSLLERAQSFLLCEWGLSLSVSESQAEGTLTELLSDSLSASNSADQSASQNN